MSIVFIVIIIVTCIYVASIFTKRLKPNEMMIIYKYDGTDKIIDAINTTEGLTLCPISKNKYDIVDITPQSFNFSSDAQSKQGVDLNVEYNIKYVFSDNRIHLQTCIDNGLLFSKSTAKSLVKDNSEQQILKYFKELDTPQDGHNHYQTIQIELLELIKNELLMYGLNVLEFKINAIKQDCSRHDRLVKALSRCVVELSPEPDKPVKENHPVVLNAPIMMENFSQLPLEKQAELIAQMALRKKIPVPEPEPPEFMKDKPKLFIERQKEILIQMQIILELTYRSNIAHANAKIISAQKHSPVDKTAIRQGKFQLALNERYRDSMNAVFPLHMEAANYSNPELQSIVHSHHQRFKDYCDKYEAIILLPDFDQFKIEIAKTRDELKQMMELFVKDIEDFRAKDEASLIQALSRPDRCFKFSTSKMPLLSDIPDDSEPALPINSATDTITPDKTEPTPASNLTDTEKLAMAQKLKAEGKMPYEIAKITGLSEYDIMSMR